MATVTGNNRWLKNKKNNELLKKFDSIMMEAWANDLTLGEALRGLNKETKDFILSLKVNTPIITDSGLELRLVLEG